MSFKSDMVAIANALDLATLQLPDINPRYANGKNGGELSQVEYRFGSLVIRCGNTRAAVQNVARKYRKGFRRETQHLLGKPSLCRPPDADALLAALEAELSDRRKPRAKAA